MGSIYAAPGGTGGGGSPADPCDLQTACDLAGPGDTIWRLPGTYLEAVDITTSGTLGNPIVMRSYAGDGVRQLLDGTGNVQTLRFLGVTDWEVYDLNLRNDRGDGVGPNINGLMITSNNGLDTGIGPLRIKIERMDVYEVNRPIVPDGISNPLAWANPAVLTMGGTAGKNIQLIEVVAYDCDTHDFPATTTFESPLLIVLGLFEDWRLLRCTFDPYRNGHQGGAFGINPIEMTSTPGVPNTQYLSKGVIKDCQFPSGHNPVALFRTNQVLIIGNTLDLSDVAMEANAEQLPGDPVGEKNWFVGNLATDAHSGFVTGPWDPTFFGTKDLFVGCNRLLNTLAPTDPAQGEMMFNAGNGAQPSVSGESLISGNVTKAPQQLLWLPNSNTATYRFERNSYLTDDPAAFYHDGVWKDFPYSATFDQPPSAKYPYDTDVDALPVFPLDIPTWWTPGATFGAYEPPLDQWITAWGRHLFTFPDDVAVVEGVSDRLVRITGLSLAAGGVGTIGLHAGAAAQVELPPSFQPTPYTTPDGGALVGLEDAIQCWCVPASDLPGFAVPIRIVKTGTTHGTFLITLTNDSPSTASPILEIWVKWH